eukprot:UN28125
MRSNDCVIEVIIKSMYRIRYCYRIKILRIIIIICCSYIIFRKAIPYFYFPCSRLSMNIKY